jgi:hypothetical protein
LGPSFHENDDFCALNDPSYDVDVSSDVHHADDVRDVDVRYSFDLLLTNVIFLNLT